MTQIASAADVARITHLVTKAHDLLDQAIEEHVHADGRFVKDIVVLFSGGNDSTTLAHLFRERATRAAHAKGEHQ